MIEAWTTLKYFVDYFKKQQHYNKRKKNQALFRPEEH